jgi:hypothetical protein
MNTDTTVTGGAQHVSAAVKKPAVKRKVIAIQDAADSLNGLGGYHGLVHVLGTDTVYYAVGVYSQTEATGTVNGITVFDQPWKNVVATFYHELNEARTDADVEDAIRAGNSPNANSFLGWISDQGEECGDYPVSEAGGHLTEVFQEVELTDNSGTVPVQFMYSNAAHAPEGPIAQRIHRSILFSEARDLLSPVGLRSSGEPRGPCLATAPLIEYHVVAPVGHVIYSA